MTQTLEQLSAAATGELLPCPFCGCRPSSDEHATQVAFYRALSAPNGYVWCEGCGAEGPEREYKPEAIAAWNTRTGQLVAVSDDAIERVARAICDASGEAWRSGEGLRYPFSHNADQLNNHWLYKAKAAIAAMKDTQP